MLTSELEIISGIKEFAIEIAILCLAFYFIEKIRPAEKQTRFFKKDFLHELQISLANTAIFSPLSTFVVSLFFVTYAHNFIPYQIFDRQISVLPILAQTFIAASIMDLSTYWRHRFTHAILWSYHSVHHSARQITWLTSLRLHPVEIFIAAAFDITLLYILGFSGTGIFIAMIFVRLYNYFTHTNINLEFDAPIRYVFASPNFHRWHHSTDKASYNKNFCAVFSFWDLLFGTYHHPQGTLPEEYGLSKQQQKGYPEPFLQQLFYPFKRDYRRWKKRKI